MVFNSYCKREKCGLFLELLLPSCFFSLFLVLFSLCVSLGSGIYCANDASVLCHAVDKRSVCLSDTHVRRSATRKPGRSLILVCQKVKTSCGYAHALMNNGTLEVSGRRCAASQQDFTVRFCLKLFRNEEEGESCILTKWILKEMQLHQNFCSGGIGLSLWSLWDSRHSLSISKHWWIWGGARNAPPLRPFFPFSCTFQQNLCQIVQ